MFINNQKTIKGKIIQIVSDKEFDSFFSFDKKGKRLNCLNIRPLNEIQNKNIFQLFCQALIKPFHIFRNNINYDSVLLDIPYVVDEKHGFELNDVVEITIKLNKLA